MFSGVCTASTDGSPTLEFSATATKVAAGRTTTLRWSATNVSACVGSGAWNREYTGVRARTGSAVSAALTERNNEFIMTCIGAGGASITRSVVVNALPAPTLTFKSSDDTPNPNQPVTLFWESTDADSCTASGSWTGALPASGSQALANLTKGTKTYSLSCRGVAGTVRSSVRLAVVAVPVVTFTTSVSTVPVGKNVTLRWSATDASACTASGDWSGVKPRSGTESIGPLTKTENNFSIACTGAGGEDSASVTVGVVSAPTVLMSVVPAVIKPGESATISWSSTDSESCRASLGWTGDKPASGSESVQVFVKGKRTYSLSCRGAAGIARGSVELQVVPSPSLTLTASAAEIAAGRSTNLRWSSTDATACAASGAWSGARNTSGSVTTEPLEAGDNIFTLRCEGPNGEDTESVTVRAVPAPTVQLTPSAEVVAPGEGLTLEWESTDAKSCTATGSWTGARETQGSVTLEDLTRGTKTYTLSCTGVGGTARVSRTVTVIPRPTVTLSSTLGEVAAGNATTLRWSSTDTSKCVASGDWSGDRSTSGSASTGPLTKVQNVFTLTCEGPNGDDQETVTIKAVQPPIVSLTASAETVEPTESVTLTWSSIDASNCTATGSWSGSKGVSGSETLTNLTRGTKTYSLTCTGVGGSVKESVVVLVVAKPGITFSAVTPEIATGNTATLRWSVTDATSCVASGDWSGSVGVSGTYTTPTLETGVTTYTLSCTGPGGEASKIATVTVVAPPGVTFRLSAEVIEPGESVTLEWSSSNTRSCRASGSWTGDKAVSGTETLSDQKRGTQRFAISCTGVGGTARVERTLVVAPKPTVTLTAAASQVNVGQGTTLSWSSTEATACVASGDWSGDKVRTGGTQATGPITKRNSVYTLTCTGAGGTAVANAAVEALGTPKLNFAISSTLVPVGQRVTLTWTSTEANSCSASGSWGGPRAVAGVEQTEALAAGIKTYTLKCEMPGSGFDEKTVTVEAVTPVLASSATALVFGKQLLGSVSDARAITLTNTSVVPLTFTGISLAGGGASQFLQSSTCGATLEPKAGCEVSVSFKPSSLGDKAANLLIASNAAGSPANIGLGGTGAAPSLQLAESSVAFGTVNVGVTSNVRKLVLRNTGNAPLNIGGIVVTGADATQFVMVNDCSASVAPEASCSIDVSFKPTSAGLKGAAVTVTSNDAASPASIALGGTGAAPQLVLSSTSVAFGSVNVGAASEARVVTVRNEGNAPLAISSIGLGGADASQFVQGTDCAASLASGGNCAITVTFKPTTAGDKTAVVSIASNASATPVTISLSGRGAAPVVLFGAASLAFGSVNVGATSDVKTMSLRNSGDALLTISSLTLAGADSNQYTQSNDCGTSLSPAASCVISVTFKPTSPGDKTASVNLSSNAGAEPASFPLTGKGTAPVVALSSASVAFGSLPVGQTSDARTVTLKNEGDATLNVSDLTLTGADAIQFVLTHDCGTTVAPAQLCTLTLRFKPTTAGDKAASVSIVSNAAGSPASLPVAGKGTAPKVVFGGASLGFGTVNVGSASSIKTLSMRNEGDAVLQIVSIGTAGPDNAQFTQTNDCGSSLAIDATCTISVTFKPTSEGNKTASVSVVSNALSSPDTVALSGTGRSPVGQLVMTPSAISFGLQTVGTTSSEQVVTVRNNGDGPLQITAMALPALLVSPTDNASFGFPTSQDCAPSLPRPLAAGASCTINVRFAPSSTAELTGKITVTTDSGTAETTLSGSGTGAIARANVNLLQFDSISVGQTSAARTVTFRNDGNASLSISAINVTGTDASQFSQTNTCGSSLAAGANCVISVTFAPTTSGAKAASVSISHGATGSPRLVSLTGAATAVVPGAPTLSGAIAGNSKITLDFTAPAFTGGTTITSYTGRCVGGSQPAVTVSGTGSPLNVGGLTNGTAYTCDVLATNSVGNGPYSSTRSATPLGVEVSGNVLVSGVMQIDSDTNDLNSTAANGTRASNNSIATAQQLYAPFVLGGYVTLQGLGQSGAVRTEGDTRDMFRVALRGGQIVSLQIAARTPTDGDLDLYLYRASDQVLVRSSATTSRLESIVVPATGDYVVEVRAFAGSSRYLLEVADSAGGASLASAAEGVEPELVVDEAIVVPRTRIATQPSSGLARTPAGALTVGDVSTPGAVETLDVVASRSNGALLVKLGDAAAAAQRKRKGGSTDPLAEGTRYESSEQEQRLRTMLRIKELARDPAVLSAEPNYRARITAVPGGSGYARQRWHYDMLRAPAAWDVTTGGSNVTIAIVDSGVSAHPDLAPNLLAGYDFVSSGAQGDDDGRDADASDPGVYSNSDRSETARRYSHGTHVAGTAAARFSGASKVTGVAGASRILPVRVLDTEGAGTTWDIADGIRYAAGLGTPTVARKADVINLSLRGVGSCPQSIQSAINEARAAGATIVASAGNDGRPTLGWPANCDGVIAVGAVTPRKDLASYSNYGSQLDLVAPGGSGTGAAGEDIYSSDLERIGTGGPTYIERAIAGTSMAAPHVSGVIALMKQMKPDLTPAQVDNLLNNGSMTDDLGVVNKDQFFGHGLANAYKAVVNANSSAADSAARIYSSVSTLNFGDAYTTWDVYITVVGLETVFVGASSSQSWIAIGSPTVVDSRTLKYTVTVNRSSLADGFYDGSIVFTPSTGPVVTVGVSLSKRSASVTGRLGYQYALLIDAVSLATKHQVAGPVAGAETPFNFGNVSAGRYFLIAGSDLDNDGFICGAAEACAYYPLTSDPEALDVDALVRGIKMGSAYLPLALTSSVDGVASLPIDGAPLDGFPVTPGRTPAVASSRQRLLPLDVPSAQMQLKPGAVQRTAAPIVEMPVTAPTSMTASTSMTGSASVTASTGSAGQTIVLVIGASSGAGVSSDATTEVAEAGASKAVSTIVSEVLDTSTGGQYRALEKAVNPAGERDWVLEYRSQGALLGVAPLSRTMDVLWRNASGAGVALPSSTWTQLCAGQVWSAQDGYQLNVGARSRGSLQMVWQGELAGQGATAAVTHLTVVGCEGSTLVLQGYELELGPRDPALTSAPLQALQFELSLDDRGSVVNRRLRRESVSLSSLCSGAVAEERARFCAIWRNAVAP